MYQPNQAFHFNITQENILPLNKLKNSLKRLLPLETYSVHTSDIAIACAFRNTKCVEPLVNLLHQRFSLIYCSISMIQRQQSIC